MELQKILDTIAPRWACSLLLVAGSLLSACSWQGLQERMSDITAARKSESVTKRLAQDSTARHLIYHSKTRTAILCRNAGAIIIETLERPSQWRIEIKQHSNNEGVDISAAVPIAEDGYFLAAAHAVEPPASLTLVVWIEDANFHGLRSVPARIVWSAGKVQRPDIAVLHAELSPLVPFSIANVPTVGDTVAATGMSNWARIAMKWGHDSGPRSFSTIGFGRVLDVGRPISGHQLLPSYRSIQHTAPTAHGDSGGALVNQHGELVAINSTVRAPRWLAWLPYIGMRIDMWMGGAGSYSQAVRPDIDWLMALIETDRRQQPARKHD